MAGAGIGQAVGGGLAAIGHFQQGKLYKAMGRAAWKMGIFNANLLKRTAASRLKAAEFEETRVSEAGKAYVGTQMAGIGKSGTAMSEGSHVLTMARSVKNIMRDRFLILRKGLEGSEEALQQANIVLAEAKWTKRVYESQKNLEYIGAGAAAASMGFAAFSATPQNTPKSPTTPSYQTGQSMQTGNMWSWGGYSQESFNPQQKTLMESIW